MNLNVLNDSFNVIISLHIMSLLSFFSAVFTVALSCHLMMYLFTLLPTISMFNQNVPYLFFNLLKFLINLHSL